MCWMHKWATKPLTEAGVHLGLQHDNPLPLQPVGVRDRKEIERLRAADGAVAEVELRHCTSLEQLQAR